MSLIKTAFNNNVHCVHHIIFDYINYTYGGYNALQTVTISFN